MKYPYMTRIAALAAVLGTGGVLAQTGVLAQAETAPVMSDVAPLPAEDRASTGAIVLENSLVRAQRNNAFQRSASRTGVASVGRGVLRATLNAQAEAELAQIRKGEVLYPPRPPASFSQ